MCSNIHPAYAGDTVRRKLRDRDEIIRVVDMSCLVLVLEYNKYMSGVDQSD